VRMHLCLAATLGLTSCGSSLSVRQGTLDRKAVERLDCIAVLPFENMTSQGDAGRLVAQALASDLLLSQRFNVMAPNEVEPVLRRISLEPTGTNRVALAQMYGRQLGVQGVLIGSVAEFERRELTSRTSAAEPVVAFLARMVDTRTGRVIWTGHASHFDDPGLLAVPHSPGAVLRQAVARTTEDLIADRESHVATRGMCATVYARLDRGLAHTVLVPQPAVQPTTLPALPPLPPRDAGNLPAPFDLRRLPAKPAPRVSPVFDAPGALPPLPALPPAGSPAKLPASPDTQRLPALGTGAPPR